MPALTRQLRNTRRAATKRTILSSLDETQVTTLPLPHKNQRDKTTDYEIDATNKEAIDLLLADLESQLQKRITNIVMNAKLACEQLNQVGFLNSLQIEKKIKTMTVKEYNETFGANVLECMQDVVKEAAARVVQEVDGKDCDMMRRKRAHLETPARTAVGPMIQRTPLYVQSEFLILDFMSCIYHHVQGTLIIFHSY